ncbi:hypothetical protein Msi02_42910 [Microbispora siamensis]|uniref:Uncharacterized protein n=1 Tax=Microbispora siamensis TaxID=564413 RepID=A0ABQ4GPW9_9ACTN|nr:hypothetical protein Msi02_42910 [Microbispora siamensis]
MYDNPGRIAKRRQGSRHNQITEYPRRGRPANSASGRSLRPAPGETAAPARPAPPKCRDGWVRPDHRGGTTRAGPYVATPDLYPPAAPATAALR